MSVRQRIARFCPQCGNPLVEQERFGMARPVCSACGHVIFFDPKVAVCVLILRDHRVLLVRRANDPKKGYWALPAGFVDWNEDPQAAARRECLEETGLHVRVVRLLDVFHTPDDGGLADIVIAYSAGVMSGELLAADDADAVAWFDRGHLPAIAFLPSQRLLERWAAGEYG